jgi:hypothetical protein
MLPSEFLRTIWICEPPKGTLEVSHVESAMKLYLEHENKWHSMSDLPKKSSLIVLEYGGCSDSKNFTIYDYDTDSFRGKFHVNGIPTRWRYFL